MNVITKRDAEKYVGSGIKTLTDMRGYMGVRESKRNFTNPLNKFIEYLNSVSYYLVLRVEDPDRADTCEENLRARHDKLRKVIKKIDYGDVYLKKSIEEAIKLRDGIKDGPELVAISE